METIGSGLVIKLRLKSQLAILKMLWQIYWLLLN
uniref:Uncharacterized protein n=1 Tax=Tetranychus urticae TaxID=32264 RepID=T1K5Z8_TETUR